MLRLLSPLLLAVLAHATDEAGLKYLEAKGKEEGRGHYPVWTDVQGASSRHR